MYWAEDAKSRLDRQDDLVCQSKSLCFMLGLPGGSDGKESACSAGNPGLIPGSGRSLGEGSGNLLQYSCLENFMVRKVESH